jgi:cytochrome P450
MSLPPGPRAPGIVQLLQFTQRPVPWLEECGRKYGDAFTVKFPGLGDFVLVSSPALIREIFTGDSDVLHAGKANILLEPFVGKHSVLLLDGAPHLRQRRLLSPPMRGERMQAYAALIGEITRAELAKMPVGRPFSMHEHMQSITLEVILRAVFGLEQGAQMQALRVLLVKMLEPPPAIMAFVPVRYLDFPFSPYRDFVKARLGVIAALRDVIRARRVALDAGGTAGTDVLSLLMAARDEDGAPMTEDELCDELITMLVAGHETTATALSWAFAVLLEHRDVAARVCDEVAGKADDPAALAQVEYLDLVVKETLRMRPIIPDVVRKTQRPMTFAGYDLPAGVGLTPVITLAHMREESWPEPRRFDPERFRGAKIDPYAWLPFGGGIRKCLGMAFAMYEMKIVLGMILPRVTMRLARPGSVPIVRRTITLAPKGGTRVVMSARAAV